MQRICVADTTDKGWDIAGASSEYFVNFYETRKDLEGRPASPRQGRDRRHDPRGNAGFWSAAVGTPGTT